MKDNKYNEWMILALYDELEPEKKEELFKALDGDAELKAEFEKLQSLLHAVSEAGFESADELSLSEARGELRAAIRAEQQKKNPFEKFLAALLFFIEPSYRPAFASLLFLIIGFGAGFLLFSGSQGNVIIPQPGDNSGFQTISLEDKNYSIRNLRFVDNDVSDGNVEFTFNIVKPVTMKGSVDDEDIQQVLLRSVLSESNPGARLQSVNVMNEGKQPYKDNEVKHAMIKVLKIDENAGVRFEALQQLGEFGFDEEIKEAYLYALQNDENNGIRIEAMNRLVEATKEGYSPDQQTLDILKDRSQKDDIQYIKTKAKTIVEEYSL